MILTGARQNPAICGTNEDNWKRRFAPALRADGRRLRRVSPERPGRAREHPGPLTGLSLRMRRVHSRARIAILWSPFPLRRAHPGPGPHTGRAREHAGPLTRLSLRPSALRASFPIALIVPQVAGFRRSPLKILPADRRTNIAHSTHPLQTPFPVHTLSGDTWRGPWKYLEMRT